MGRCNGLQPQLFLPESFGDCLSYERQIRWLYKKVSELEQRVAELENKQEDPQVS